MILQALYRLAEREHLVDDPDYETKPVDWLVRVGPDGTLLGIVGTHVTPAPEGKRKPKPQAKAFRIPRRPTGKSGTKAPSAFLVENAKYVFGLPTADKPFSADEGREKSGWFLDLVRSCADGTSDEAVRAVVRLLERVRSGETAVLLPETCASNHLFAFVYEPDIDELVHLRPAVRDYWQTVRQRNAPGETNAHQCLVSGKDFGDVPLFPLVQRIPGGSTSGVGLVSYNFPAVCSYGWASNENGPVSREAAEACATALARLVHTAYPDPSDLNRTLPRRNLKVSDDTVVCYWTAESPGEEFCSVFAGLMEGNPETVAAMYRSIWHGRAPAIGDPSAFYALTLTGTQGRAVVRDWFESTVAQVAANLAQHFADLDLVRVTPKPRDRELPPQMPLGVLFESLAPPAKNRREEIPAPLEAATVRAALGGTLYPMALLQRALLRYRAEIANERDENDGWKTKQWNDARAALAKAVLNRRARLLKNANYREVQREMDPTNSSEGYALGRLMAVLERLQQEALGDPNASVVDRYFSGASASPKSVFTRLLKNARHHARKAKDDPQRAGTAFLLDRLVDELADRFDPKANGFPAALDLEQQGLFVIGYHQMRKWLWMTAEERAAWETAHADAPRAYLWKKNQSAAA